MRMVDASKPFINALPLLHKCIVQMPTGFRMRVCALPALRRRLPSCWIAICRIGQMARECYIRPVTHSSLGVLMSSLSRGGRGFGVLDGECQIKCMVCIPNPADPEGGCDDLGKVKRNIEV